jgi:hypothetical protein
MNRAGWSELSPYLDLITGKLPSPPVQAPVQLAVSPTSIRFGWQPSTDIGGAEKLENYYIYSGLTKIDEVSS